MDEPVAFVDRSTCSTTRRTHICYFEATNLVLEEKGQGIEVRVGRISDESVG